MCTTGSISRDEVLALYWKRQIAVQDN